MAKANQTKTDIVDKLVKEVDPVMVAGAVAAGVAGWYGFRGPLTTILGAFNGSSPITPVTNPTSDPIGYLIWSYPPLGLIRAIYLLTGMNQSQSDSALSSQQYYPGGIYTPPGTSGGIATEPNREMSLEERKAYAMAWGNAMSNVCEFMVTYSIANNPGTPGMLMEGVKMLGENLKGLGGLVTML